MPLPFFSTKSAKSAKSVTLPANILGDGPSDMPTADRRCFVSVASVPVPTCTLAATDCPPSYNVPDGVYGDSADIFTPCVGCSFVRDYNDNLDVGAAVDHTDSGCAPLLPKKQLHQPQHVPMLVHHQQSGLRGLPSYFSVSHVGYTPLPGTENNNRQSSSSNKICCRPCRIYTYFLLTLALATFCFLELLPCLTPVTINSVTLAMPHTGSQSTLPFVVDLSITPPIPLFFKVDSLSIGYELTLVNENNNENVYLGASVGTVVERLPKNELEKSRAGTHFATSKFELALGAGHVITVVGELFDQCVKNQYFELSFRSYGKGIFGLSLPFSLFSNTQNVRVSCVLG